MDATLLRIFQMQIDHQCYAALLAADNAPAGLHDMDSRRFWANIQNCLTAVANISKALWGQGGRYANEREDLRIRLQVDDNSPLRSTGMRNNFEHIDERIDWWHKNSVTKNFTDWLVGSSNDMSGMDVTDADTDIFRRFDYSTGDVTFWGVRYPLATILVEVERLQIVVNQEAEKWP
jgi:hypothetical protein